MKNFFDKQFFLFFKKNIIYFIALFSLLFFIVFLIYQIILKNYELSEKIKTTNEQNNALNNKIKKLNTLANYNLEDNIKLVNKIIPKDDDIFTVIYTLLKLGSKLNVAIPYFEINNRQIKDGKFTLRVEIITDDILDFFRKYLLSSGRLITISSVKVNTEGNKYSLDLNFYNFGSKLNHQKDIYQLNMDYINKINEMVKDGTIFLESEGKDNTLNPQAQYEIQYDFQKINPSDDPFSSR